MNISSHHNMTRGTYNTLQDMYVTALQEITCPVMYCTFPHHINFIQVSDYVQLKRVPEFSTQFYKIGIQGHPR